MEEVDWNNKNVKVLDSSKIEKVLLDYSTVDIDSIPTSCKKGETDEEIIDNFIKDYGVSSLPRK